MLRTAMGPEIAAALEDPEVVEVLLNPDGSLWVDRLGTGREPTGAALPPAVAERIIRLVAAHVRAEVHAGLPILSAELPETGERFLGVLPPVVRAPSFAIRKRALRIMTLAQYVDDCILTEDEGAVAEFFARVDSAILMHNASTQFADGGEFGMGAEIGIATGKMHARGPVGAEQLTSFKYLVDGKGAVRA